MPRSDALQRLQDQFNVGQFTLLEFDQALKTTKNNKQAGPDGIAMELFKWMDAENRNFLLNIINHWWRHKQAPESIFRARVVSIFKKGDTDLPENYRPISLLTTIYKIYMIMIRKRLQVVLEDHLCETQYGFRPSRSTSHAIFLTRRLQDISEQQGSNMILLFLDWEKAFDRIKHDRLWIALQRLGIHEHFIDVLQDGYRKASFFVEDEHGASQTKKQRAGIRQGCPLSPYLFVLLMSIVDEDVKYRLQNPRNFRTPSSSLPIHRVYYADDTILITTSTRAANKQLAEVERVSLQFGLKLNRGKCNYISMNGNNVIKFPDGQKMERVEETTYLGHQITKQMDVKHEINHKMSQTLRTWFKLETFWKAVDCTTKWKLQVYDAVIRNKLLYGLETVHLTQSLQRKVNAFQLRGLRKVLGLTTTYVNRQNTNEFVVRKANEELGHQPGTPLKIKLFSDLLLDRRIRLAGHILRSNDNDPLRRVSYEPNSAVTFDVGKRRVGGPRQQWTQYSNKYAWENALGKGRYENTAQQNQELLNCARSRQF